VLTPRENLLRTFRHEEPEWVPVIALGDGYNRPAHMPSSFYEDERRMTVSRALSRYFGLDVLDRIGGWEERYHDVGYSRSVEDGLERQCWETPYGTITASRQEVRYPSAPGEPELVTSFPVEYPLKSAADYRAFAYIFEHLEYVFHDDEIEAKVREVGEEGIVTIGAPSSPLGMCVRLYAGVQHLAYAFSDHRQELGRLLETIAEKNYECYQRIANLPVDGTINYDDTTTYAISPAMFRDLELPYLRRTAEVLHQAGKLCIHHACGHIAALLPDLAQAGIDGLDGPALPPVGDTSVSMARRGFGEEIVIMPFLEQTAIESGDYGVIRSSVRQVFAEAGSHRAFVFDVVPPPAAPVESLWAAVEEAKRLSSRH
jgi:uroporphyrinogen-III decarboxylase